METFHVDWSYIVIEVYVMTILLLYYFRKKSPYSEPNTSVCNICSFIKVLAVFLMISILALLGVLTVLLYEQIQDLRKTLRFGKYISSGFTRAYIVNINLGPEVIWSIAEQVRNSQRTSELFMYFDILSLTFIMHESQILFGSIIDV